MESAVTPSLGARAPWVGHVVALGGGEGNDVSLAQATGLGRLNRLSKLAPPTADPQTGCQHGSWPPVRGGADAGVLPTLCSCRGLGWLLVQFLRFRTAGRNSGCWHPLMQMPTEWKLAKFVRHPWFSVLAVSFYSGEIRWVSLRAHLCEKTITPTVCLLIAAPAFLPWYLALYIAALLVWVGRNWSNCYTVPPKAGRAVCSSHSFFIIF